MLEKLRSLGKQTAVYGMGNILNKLLGFILIPLYQNHIPIGQFGNLVYFEMIIVFLSTLLTFGITHAHQRFYVIEKENKTYGKFLFNNILGNALLAILALLPWIIFAKPTANVLCEYEGASTLLLLSLATILFEILYTYPMQVLQYEEKPLIYLFWNAFKLIMSFSLTIFLVINFNMGVEGIFYARLIGAALAVIITYTFIIIPRCTFKFDWEPIKKALIFGFPLIVSNLGFNLFMISDRLLLNALSTDSEVGKYGFGMKIANFINLIFIQTIGVSYMPAVVGNENKDNNLRFYRKMLTYYCFIIGFAILGFLLFYRDILWVVGKNKEYWEGLKVVPLLALSFMVMGMNGFLGVGIYLKKRTSKYLIPSFSALGVNITINYIFIPQYGMLAAGVAVLIAQIVYTSLIAWNSERVMQINYEWGKILLIYFLLIGMILIDENVFNKSLILHYSTKLLMIGFFPLLLYKLNFFEAIEIDRIKAGLQKTLIRFVKK